MSENSGSHSLNEPPTVEATSGGGGGVGGNTKGYRSLTDGGLLCGGVATSLAAFHFARGNGGAEDNTCCWLGDGTLRGHFFGLP